MNRPLYAPTPSRPKRVALSCAALWLAGYGTVAVAQAQAQASAATESVISESSPSRVETSTSVLKTSASIHNTHPASASPLGFARNFVDDQRAIWTAPFKARIENLNWLVPVAGVTAGLINADAELSSRISNTGTLARHSGTAANAGLVVLEGSSAGLYLLGKLKNNDHQQETGILAGEAALDAVMITETFKVLTRRERPTDGAGQGRFGKGTALNSSFPSLHSALAWSAASVLSHEYPGVLTRVLSYGVAGSVSLARVTGKSHFPSDVVVGSALGWFLGEQVYARHHDPLLPGGGYGTFERALPAETSNTQNLSSPYVPMDSWVYPAFERLGAMGVINSGLFGLRPWTRRECARLLEEASDSVDESSPNDESSRLYAALAREFSPELNGEPAPYVSLDSLYTGVTNISGKPLTDGYHFGQTIVNNFGRPYQQGLNSQTGFSASGSNGALGFYVRGEWEHAPSAPGVSQAVQDAIQLGDAKTTNAAEAGPPIPQPVSPIPAFNQFRLLDTYLMLNIKGWQTSFGKQTLWTGPTEDPFLASSNAEPMYMLRVDQTNPTKLPGILGFLGPTRSEFWVAKLVGQHYVNTQNGTIVFRQGRTLAQQPMLNGMKVSFKPTPNFEFGVGRTGLWGGPDFPITLHTTFNSLLSTTNAAGRGNDPGDRRSTFDFSYRIPGLRRWLTLYEDSFVEDEISPIGYPRRAAHNPGIYLSHFPGLPHVDLRAEAAYTNLPGLLEPIGGGFFYWNVRYLDGYTNQGNIIGNATVGRQGISLRAESTYWFASDKTVRAGYRSNNVDSMFLQGGNLRDAFLQSQWSFRHNLSLQSFLQYEWWNFPLLAAGKNKNFTASFQITYWPHWRMKRGS